MKHFNKLLFFILIFSFILSTQVFAYDNADIKDRIIYNNNNELNLPIKAGYGYSVANIGDLNNDGIDDFAVSATGTLKENEGNRYGRVFIHFMDEDYKIKQTKVINPEDNPDIVTGKGNRYGSDIASLGDLDGDNIPDIAIGAEGTGKEKGSNGKVYVHFMNSDGSIKKTEVIDCPDKGRNFFGSAVAAFDFYGRDGIVDTLAIGAKKKSGEQNETGQFKEGGKVYIIRINVDNDGNFDYWREEGVDIEANDNINPHALYGASLANIGDVNGDGFDDLLVGAPNAIGNGGEEDEDCDNTYCEIGGAYLHLLGEHGAVKETHAYYLPNSEVTNNGKVEVLRYGISVSGADLNKDGIVDLIVGASGKYGNDGIVYIHYLNKELDVVSTEEIDDETRNGAKDTGYDEYFGSGINNVGDLDGNGVDDLLIGAIGSNNQVGLASLHFMNESKVAKQSAQNRSVQIVGCVPEEDVVFTPIFRLYNTRTGAHLYTRGEADRDKVLAKYSDFVDDDGDPAFFASLQPVCEFTPIYRLYNKRTGAHLYTIGETDRDKVLDKYKDFVFDDNAPAFYARTTAKNGYTPIYRLYNTRTGFHLYTRGEADRDKILKKYPDFRFDDNAPAFYALLNY